MDVYAFASVSIYVGFHALHMYYVLKLNLQKKVIFFANRLPSMGIFVNKKVGNQKN